MANITINIVCECHLDGCCCGQGHVLGTLEYPEEWTPEHLERAKRGYRCEICDVAGAETRERMAAATVEERATIRAEIMKAIAPAIDQNGKIDLAAAMQRGDMKREDLTTAVEVAEAAIVADTEPAIP